MLVAPFRVVAPLTRRVEEIVVAPFRVTAPDPVVKVPVPDCKKLPDAIVIPVRLPHY